MPPGLSHLGPQTLGYIFTQPNPFELDVPFKSWSELIGTLGRFDGGTWGRFVMWLVILLIALFGMHIYDERSLHTGFMPTWHRLLTCGGWESNVRWRQRTLRFVTICTIIFVTKHQVPSTEHPNEPCIPLLRL